jgi:GTPase SAR1 family protein
MDDLNDTGKKERPFEVKVAFIGNVNVGKSTIINALLRGWFSEVSMFRTTNAVYKFRIQVKGSEEESRREGKRKAEDMEAESDGFALMETESNELELNSKHQPSESIHQDTVANNLRNRNITTLEDDKVYDIPMNCGVLGEMREDTNLTLIDIPGLDDAEKSRMHLAYIDKHWCSFDCVVVVMDASNGVSKKAEVDLLEKIKENMEKQRRVPVIILFNKYEKLDAQKRQLLVETRDKVANIFGVSDRGQALEDLLKAIEGGGDGVDDFPILIPVSAQYALLLHNACISKSLETFMELSSGLLFELVEEFGKVEVGMKTWLLFQSKEEKLEKVYEELQDGPFFDAKLKETNFAKFMDIFRNKVCSRDAQTKMIQSQLNFLMAKTGVEDLMRVLDECYQRMLALGQGTYDPLYAFFWKGYRTSEDTGFHLLEGPQNVKELEQPLKLLMQYYKFCRTADWQSQMQTVALKFEALVRRQLTFVHHQIQLHNRISEGRWANMSRRNWASLVRSVMIADVDRSFREKFGSLKILIEEELDTIMRGHDEVSDNMWKLSVPERLTDPSHWGHLGWVFGEFLEDAKDIDEE